MSDLFERPVFVDGQRLNADDLTALTTYAREPLAQHLRSQHTPGVVAGLELDTDNTRGVTVKPGCFVDHLGQLVVITGAFSISLTDTAQVVDDKTNQDNSYPLPVFISADAQGAVIGVGGQRCGPTSVGRVVEEATGRIVSAGVQPRAPQVVPYGALDRSPSGQTSEIRLGAVIASPKTGVVKSVSTDPLVGPQYSGLVAGYVGGHGKRLRLAAGDGAVEKGIALVVKDDGLALMNGTDELFTVGSGGAVTVKGDLTSTGQITGAKGVGPAVVTARASGPIRPPLPAGITAADIGQDGNYRVNVLIAPDLAVAPANETLAFTAFGVDSNRFAQCDVLVGALKKPQTGFRYSVIVSPR